MNIPLPFVTDRSELALILELLGEKRVHIRNSYSAAKLAELGCSNITEALTRRAAGKVEYLFEQSPQISKIVTAYFDQVKRNERREPTDKPNATDAELTRFAVSVLMMRKAYVELWKTASVHATEGGKVTDAPTDFITITKEILESGVLMEGHELKEGEKIPIEGVRTYEPYKSVGVAVPKAARAEVGL